MNINDLGFLSQRQRALHLRCSLITDGLACVVTRAVIVLDGFEEVFPEPETSWAASDPVPVPGETTTAVGDQPAPVTFTCRVLVDKPLEGLMLNNDVISLTDKIETQHTVTTDATLELEDSLLVTYTDGRTINLRVVERLSQHPEYATGNHYVCIVGGS